MPFDPLTAVFNRVWKFVDQREQGDQVTRSDLDTALDDLAAGINSAIDMGLNFVGEWSAASGVFPTSRPDGGAIKAKDAWIVSVGGTTGGVTFAAYETLVALRSNPGPSYPGNWLRLTIVTTPGAVAILTAAETAQADAETAQAAAEAAQAGAETARDDAAASALSSLLSSAAAGAASGRLDVAAFAQLATKFVYSGPGDGQELAAQGDIILWRGAGIAYEVADASASDAHLDYTGAGGLKLYIQADIDGWIDFRATGAVADAADHSAQWDVAVGASKKIYIPPGTWRFNYKSIPAGTKLRGDRGLTIVRPTTSGIRAALTANSGSALAVLDDIEIEGITFVDDVVGEGGFEDDNLYGQIHLLTLHGMNRAVVHNCEFIGFRGDGIYLGSDDVGGNERHNFDVKIIDCRFDGINKRNRNGLSVIDCDGLEVTGCLFENCSWSFAPGAIDLEPNHEWNVIRNINIHHNRFRNVGSAACGFLLNLADTFFDNRPYALQFTDNHIEDCVTGFAALSRETISDLTYDCGLEFRGNKVINSTSPFFVYGARGAVIENNEFIGSTRPAELGSGVWNMVGTKIRDNVFYQCASDNTFGRAAILVTNVDDLEIEGNDFIDCGRASGSTGFCLEFVSGFTGTKIKLRRNQFLAPTGRTTRAIRTSGYTLTASGNVDEDNIYGFATVYEFTAPGSRHLTAAPTTGTWAVGDTVYNSAPANGVYGWVCTAAGTPGTWAPLPCIDYATGSFTPIVAGTTSAGTGTYISQVGRFTRVGDLCFFELYLNISAHTGTGDIEITGLPFTALNLSSVRGGCDVGFMSGLTLPASSVLFPQIVGNSAKIALTTASTAGGGGLTPVAMDTAFAIGLAGFYKIQ